MKFIIVLSLRLSVSYRLPHGLGPGPRALGFVPSHHALAAGQGAAGASSQDKPLEVSKAIRFHLNSI